MILPLGSISPDTGYHFPSLYGLGYGYAGRIMPRLPAPATLAVRADVRDSVPAIFTITLDPYIVYTSNIFAILGLRALYFALAAIIHRFKYLNQALAWVLIFIGSKTFIADWVGWEKFPASISLGVTFALIIAGVVVSLYKTRNFRTTTI